MLNYDHLRICFPIFVIIHFGAELRDNDAFYSKEMN